MEAWEVELNGHIEVFKLPNAEWEEYVPFLAAKRMIATREQRIAELEAQLETAKEDAIAEYDRVINRELMKQGRTLSL